MNEPGAFSPPTGVPSLHEGTRFRLTVWPEDK